MQRRDADEIEGDYQEYLGDVITRNTSRDVAGAEGRDSYKRPDPSHPRFSQAAEDRRQLKAQARADKGRGLTSTLIPNAPMRHGMQFSGR